MQKMKLLWMRLRIKVLILLFVTENQSINFVNLFAQKMKLLWMKMRIKVALVS